MNSELSTEIADSALAVVNNDDKRHPWACVYMKIVAEARVQNINNAGKGKQISFTQWLIQMACYPLCLSGCVYVFRKILWKVFEVLKLIFNFNDGMSQIVGSNQSKQ